MCCVPETVPDVRDLANKDLFWTDFLSGLERATLIALGVRTRSRLSGGAHDCPGPAGGPKVLVTVLELCAAEIRYKSSGKA